MRLNTGRGVRIFATVCCLGGFFLFSLCWRWVADLAHIFPNILVGFRNADQPLQRAAFQALGHAVVFVLFALCLAGFGGVGGSLRLLGLRANDSLADRLIDTALGLLVVSCAWLGLGLAGLAFPVFAVATVAVLAFSGAPRIRNTFTGGRIGTGTLLVALVILPAALSPESEVDCLISYLALPSAYADNHKLYSRPETVVGACPQGQEMLHVAALLLGSEESTKLLSWAAVLLAGLCGTALLSSFLPPAVARLAAPGIIASPGMLVLASRSKSEAMSAFFIGASLLALSRKDGRGAFLAGLLAGSAYFFKITGALAVPALLVSCLAFRRARSRLFGLALTGAVAASAPWCARNWLELANPVFPLMMNSFNTPGWGKVNSELAAGTFMLQWRAADPHGPAGLLFAILGAISSFNLVTAFGLLLSFWIWNNNPGLRWLVAFTACFITEWLTVLPWQNRYLYAAMVPFTVLSLFGWHVFRGARGRLLFATSTVCALSVSTGLVTGLGGLPWRGSPLAHFLGLESSESYQRRTLGNYHGAVIAVEREVARGRKALAVGDWRSYPVSSRVLCGGDALSTPFVWHCARLSDSPERMLARFRQRGISHVLFNLPQAAYAAGIAAHFPWSTDAMKVYSAFWHRHATLVWRSPAGDAEGYFLLYRLDPAGTGKPFRAFLPGTEGEFNHLRELVAQGADDRAVGTELGRLERLFGRAPDFLSRRGLVFVQQGRWGRALADYKAIGIMAPEASGLYADWGAVRFPKGSRQDAAGEQFLAASFRTVGENVSVYLNLGLPFVCQ